MWIYMYSYTFTGWSKKSLWCDLEEKCLRNSKKKNYGVFFSIYSSFSISVQDNSYSYLVLKYQASKIKNCNRGHKIFNSAAKVPFFKKLVTLKLIDLVK